MRRAVFSATIPETVEMVSTSEISDLIEKIYGHHYSPATMSNISKAVADQVENFHKRQLSERYAVIFMDATYLNVRRDSVAKEPLHVLLGITPDGTREVSGSRASAMLGSSFTPLTRLNGCPISEAAVFLYSTNILHDVVPVQF